MALQRLSDREETNAKPPPPPAGDLFVERITHRDVPEVAALLKKVWDAQRPELPAELVKEWEPTPLEFMSRMEGVTFFAARRDGRLIGLIGCEVEGHSAHFHMLVVDPTARRQGVGSALTRAGIEWARRTGCTSIWFDPLAQFTALPPLLKRLGFAEAGVLHRHLWNEDVLYFEQLL